MIEPNEIMRMSLGCANEAGNAVSWASLTITSSSLCPVILHQKDLSCRDREGKYTSSFDISDHYGRVVGIPINTNLG